MNQEKLMQELEGSRQALLALIDGLPSESFTEKGVMDEWTLKDILAHICRWEGLCVTLLWKLRQGLPAERLDIKGEEQIDQLNAQWYQEDKERSLDLVLADFRGLRKQTLRRVQEFSDSELTDPNTFDGLRGEPLWKWIAVDTFEHETDHIPAIRSWLKNRV